MNLSDEHQRCLLDLARASLRAALTGERPPPLPEDEDLRQSAGCFVSLHAVEGHRLRGCVGRLDAKGPLAEVVSAMAQAVLEDPRFRDSLLTVEKGKGLEIELSILSPL